MTTLASTQPPTTNRSQPSPARPSLALASDPGKALRLAPTLQPDVDLLTAEGVIVFGVKGSGKSNLLALLVEQLGRFHLPQLIFDTEREYASLLPLLPRGVHATATQCPAGADILRHGLQVVVDLPSWESDEAAGRAIVRLVNELFAATTALAPVERVPCVLHLDEASSWLPQDAVTSLSKETRKALADAFHKLASRGRKQGLIPFLYTQSISEVAKSAIRQSGVKVLMRQTLDLDVQRCCQYIQGATARTRKAMQAFPSGRAIVLLPDGSQHRVQFHARQSEHVSQTPQVQAALARFAARDLDLASIPMRDLTAAPSGKAQQEEQKQGGKAGHTSAKERIQQALATDPSLLPVTLAMLAGCDPAHASRVRTAYLEAHPHAAAQVAAQRPMGKMEQRLRGLLDENPQYTPSQLAHRTNYSLKDVRAVLARVQQQAKQVSVKQVKAPSKREQEEHAQPAASSKGASSPLTQAARQRLEEAERRLTEQGQQVTRDRLAREAQIGSHTASAFLREKREAQGHAGK